MTRFLEILPDSAQLIERCLSVILEQITNRLVEVEKFSLVLSGGNTPKPLYEALSKEDLPWERIHIFWGDERYVLSEHPDSNQGMARLAWLEHIDIPTANIHPIPTGSGDPSLDAQRYAKELEEWFKTDFPIFDLVLLGMGDDGHTASLFPGTKALKVIDKSVTVGFKGKEPRITLTLPSINQARCVIFLVTGENKRYPLSQIFANEVDLENYPAGLIKPQGDLWWLLDKSAGRELKDR